MGQRAAIATTLRNAEPVLESFIVYHLSVGFEHLFLFFDDPSDPAVRIAERFEKVTCVVNDNALRRRWEATPLFAEERIVRSIDTEVMARQMLNAQVAVEMAQQRGVDWLLHIDVDELFYSFSGAVPEHFQQLADRGVACVSYPNHEAVPERVDVNDFFREVTLFKRNPTTRNEPGFTPRQQLLLRSVPQIPRKFFLFYGNGKSAARVSKDLRVVSVHDFQVPDERTRVKVHKNPVILHYPVCGFGHFWDKYTTLGRFDDHWFGTFDINAAIGSFHTDSRDIVTSGDREAARRFYEERVVIGDCATARELVDSGLCLRISEPADLLAGRARGPA